MKKYYFLVIGFVLILIMLLFYKTNPLKPKAIINGHTIYLELAVTSDEKEKGLGERLSMPANTGMLFVYDHKEKFSFWMKGMQFPLDFVFINEKQIVEVFRNVPIETDGKITKIIPKNEADKILELNAGIIDRINIKVGDTFDFDS